MSDIASLVLRLGVGIMFFAHGLQIALGKFNGPGAQGFAAMLGKMGFAPPLLWSYLAGYSTLIGGLCLIVGFCARIATIPLFIFMFVAMVKVHLSKGFFLMQGGFEYTFVVLCALIAIAALGTGKYGVTKNF
jgi:putative oxidoreductase